MLSHRQIWSAIDALAARYSMSVSGLARRAGLDPTTFNKSKRAAGDGRLRWPNTESISKILEATGCSIEEFMSLVSNSATDDTT
jgi:phage repressor protein C with HTH and peptisase S24 domain